MSKSVERSPRVLVIGLDAATFSLLDPWMAEGRLPNLSRLASKGARGVLRSTIPYASSTAWVTFMTGVNPGKHGVLDFVARDSRTGQVRVNTCRSIRVQTLWDILSRHGRSAHVLNVPLTYPPPPLNGLLVSGMLTPHTRAAFTTPASLSQELLAEIPDYAIEPAVVSRDRMKTKEDLAANAPRLVQQRLEAFALMHRKSPDWDLALCVFTETDRVQHYLWDDMDPAHPLHEPDSARRFGGAIRDLYAQIDSAIGELLRMAGEGCRVLVLSDHGATAIHRYFYPNRWLAEEGFLVFKNNLSRKIDLIRKGAAWLGIDHPLKKMVEFLNSMGFISGLRNEILLRDVDWLKTRVYWAADNGFTINLRGREPQGIVEPEGEYDRLREILSERLLDLSDPATGDKVVEHVCRREEIYRGPYMEHSPDLKVVWREYPEQGKAYYAANDPWSEGSFGPAIQAADHTLNGMLIACGEEIRGGTEVSGVELIDMAPTILYMLGLPVPKEMDGKVAAGLFDADFLRWHPVCYEDASGNVVAASLEGVDEQEQKELVRSLKGLGYLS